MTVDAERAQVIAEARSWIGTPFHSGARVKGAGVDCANLLAASFSSLVSVAIPPYPPDWFLHNDRERFLEMLSPVCDVVGTPELADIAVFRFGRAISHGGVVVDLDPLRIVHAFRPTKGVQVDEIGEGSGLATRLAGYWRLRRWGSR